MLDLLGGAQDRHKKDIDELEDPEQVLNITKVYADAVSQVTNKLLKDTQVWFGLPEEFRHGNSSLMQEQLEIANVGMAVLLSNETQIFAYDKVGVRAERFDRQHYQVPENRVFTHIDHDNNNKIELPEGFATSLPEDDQVAITFTSFNSLHCVLGQGIVCDPVDLTEKIVVKYPLRGVVNSYMMGLTVGNTSWVPPPSVDNNTDVTITFQHLFSGEQYELNRSTAECVWWDADNNSWSSSGCRFTYFNLTFSKCSCNHLTNFAIIMDINGVVNPDDVLLGWITCLGCSLSLVCLAVAIVTLITHKLKCQRSASAKTTRIIRVNICACLFVSEVVLLAGLDKTENEAGCAVVAGFLHYFLLAYFFWMGVEGVNVYFLLVRVFQTSRSPLRYYLASGYGLPALIVAISAGVRYNGYGTKTFCWLDPNYHGLIWAFSGPALCILLVNVVMFTLGMRVLLRQRPGEPSRNKKEARQRKKQLLKSSFTLATLMGLTWLTGYLYVSKGSEALEVLFTLVASLQGVVLFLVLVILPPLPRAHLVSLATCEVLKETQRRKKSLATGFTMDYSSESIPINPRGSSELDISVARDIQDRQVIQNPPSCGGEDQQIIFTVKVPITPRGSSELDIHVARDCKNNKSSDRQGGQYRIESSDRQDRQYLR
ncbi:latrophilin-like protein LAT-2 [Homarus americanus]|uniref:latrophilin-like protein LAT-2 n=1 Tax=Homarus americanus TaxID=6706 RepID=UPI001C43AA27|nr:latrophilin-like protein LAT-2 [Homarus americanus]